MRRLGALVLLLALAGCGGSSKPAPKAAARVTVAGTVAVDDVAMGLHHCNPRYAASADDAVTGATVTVYNAAGVVVGTTALGRGVLAQTNNTGFEGCAYSYSVSVPSSAFYQVQVAGRDKVTFRSAAAQGSADIKIEDVGS